MSLLGAVFALLAFPVAKSQETALTIRVSPVANLYYQLGCLVDGGHCSQPAYEELWTEQGWLDAEANRLLTEFAAISNRYGTSVWLRGERPSPALLGLPIPDMGPDPASYFDLSQRLRTASFMSDSLDGLRERLMLVMTTPDAARMTEIVSHFEPAFQQWWARDAVAPMTAVKKELNALLASEINSTVGAAVAFYGVQNASVIEGLTLNLMFRPPHDSPSRGQQIQQHSVVEVVSGETAQHRIGVVVHELAHYLYSLAPPNWHQLRLKGAMKAESANASVALGLMDEALATAIGNGVLEKRLRGDVGYKVYADAPLSFYNDPQIDQSAKLMVDLVEQYLSEGVAMDQPFVDRYFDRVLNKLDASLDSLEQRLAVTVAVVGDSQLESLMRELRRSIGNRSLWTLDVEEDLGNSILANHPYLHGVVIAHPGQLSDLLERLGERTVAPPADTVCTLKRHGGPGLLYLAPVESHPKVDTLLLRLRQAQPCT
ncbi:MAG: hypothetical protein AAF358_16445 [Pseudomonadota bacterium]